VEFIAEQFFYLVLDYQKTSGQKLYPDATNNSSDFKRQRHSHKPTSVIDCQYVEIAGQERLDNSTA